MLTETKIVCLPVGRRWQPSKKRQFEKVVSGLDSDVVVSVLDPAYSETNILDRIAELELSKPAFLLIAALEGGSARQMVLAASKSCLPTGIWCHNENHSLASSVLASEGLRQLNHPFVLLGEGSVDELGQAVRAAAAKKRLACARIGTLGPTHFNLVCANLDPLLLLQRFGTWVAPISIATLRRRIDEVADKRIGATLRDMAERFSISVEEPMLRKAVAMYLAIKSLAEEARLDALAIDCWNEILPEFGISPHLAYLDDDLIISTEGDVIVAATMVAGRGMSGGAGYVGDLYSFDEQTGEAVLIHASGPASLHCSSEKMEITRQSPPGPIGELGSVVACRPLLPEGPGTLLLLHGRRLERLHLRSCEILRTEFPDQMNVHVKIAGDSRVFRRNAAGNHYVVFPGDLTEAWRLWAQWSGVNIDEATSL